MSSTLVDAFQRLNARHPWSHNDHFHGWILTELPARRGTAMDVGCGRGALAATLAERFDAVVAVDRDAEMREVTRRRCAGLPNVDVPYVPWEEVAGPLDLVTMVAVLHHLDMPATLAHVREVLAPGGRFLCVGLNAVRSPADLAWRAADIVTNPVIGWVKHPWTNREPMSQEPFPTKDPEDGLASIRRVVRQELPGADVRRHLGFRYTIRWEKPAGGPTSRSSAGDASPR